MINLTHHFDLLQGIFQVICLIVSLDQLLLPVFVLFGIWETNKVVLFDGCLLLESLLDLFIKLVSHALLPSLIVIEKVISALSDEMGLASFFLNFLSPSKHIFFGKSS
jgi:hypothetical protein